MLCILSPINDPNFNLAAEEYLLRNRRDDVFMLWTSSEAVVVGKHQNTLAEINYPFIRENNITVARRISGGGTVFHGAGNINFSFVRNGEEGKLVDFTRFIHPVVDFLRSLGMEALQGSRNDIISGGRKISGNAEHVFKTRVLHHGTLLFNADLNRLRESLNTLPGKYRDRAVQSVRSSVINIADCLHEPMTREEFSEKFFAFMVNRFGGRQYQLDERETGIIGELATSKFNTWEWVYGWSPDYEMNLIYDQEIDFEVHLKVHRGFIQDCRLKSAKLPEDCISGAGEILKGSRHEFQQIRGKIQKTSLHKMLGAELDDLTLRFF